MDKQEEIMKLSNEVIELIKEFNKEEEVIGENLVQEIKIKENGRIIEIRDFFGEIKEFKLSNVSGIYKRQLEGFGPCGSGFYEAFNIAKNNIIGDCKDMSKDEAIKAIGTIYYAEMKCEEIYERLKEIDKEAEKLL